MPNKQAILWLSGSILLAAVMLVVLILPGLSNTSLLSTFSLLPLSEDRVDFLGSGINSNKDVAAKPAVVPLGDRPTSYPQASFSRLPEKSVAPKLMTDSGDVDELSQDGVSISSGLSKCPKVHIEKFEYKFNSGNPTWGFHNDQATLSYKLNTFGLPASRKLQVGRFKSCNGAPWNVELPPLNFLNNHAYADSIGMPVFACPPATADQTNYYRYIAAVHNTTNGVVKVCTVSSTLVVQPLPPPPSVTNVTSSNANGTYFAGGPDINIQITFTEAVNVNGTPQLKLKTGPITTSQNANYSTGFGSATLTFVYNIQPGDATPDLDYYDANALLLNSGSIKNAANTADAVLTLPNPGYPGSLGHNKDIEITTPSPPPGPYMVFHNNTPGLVMQGDTVFVGYLLPTQLTPHVGDKIDLRKEGGGYFSSPVLTDGYPSAVPPIELSDPNDYPIPWVMSVDPGNYKWYYWKRHVTMWGGFWYSLEDVSDLITVVAPPPAPPLPPPPPPAAGYSVSYKPHTPPPPTDFPYGSTANVTYTNPSQTSNIQDRIQLKMMTPTLGGFSYSLNLADPYPLPGTFPMNAPLSVPEGTYRFLYIKYDPYAPSPPYVVVATSNDLNVIDGPAPDPYVINVSPATVAQGGIMSVSYIIPSASSGPLSQHTIRRIQQPGGIEMGREDNLVPYGGYIGSIPWVMNVSPGTYKFVISKSATAPPTPPFVDKKESLEVQVTSSSCGNGILDPGETCDPPYGCNYEHQRCDNCTQCINEPNPTLAALPVSGEQSSGSFLQSIGKLYTNLRSMIVAPFL